MKASSHFGDDTDNWLVQAQWVQLPACGATMDHKCTKIVPNL
jgi:hypothetical protein